MSNPLLEVSNLHIALPGFADRPYAVRDLSFSLGYGETLCIVGESGSGKSMTAHALMGLLPPPLVIGDGSLRLEGQELVALDEGSFRKLRGGEMGMVFQEPMTSLNPVLTVGRQVKEVLAAHGFSRSGSALERRVVELFEEVGLPDPAALQHSYPHELSGGQRQRVMIAIAIAMNPRLLIADEPTTALDVTTQAQILELLARLQASHGMSMLFITHDLGVVRDIADRILVMRHGELVEQGSADDIFQRPQQQYTQDLLAALPSLEPPAPRPSIIREPILEVKSVSKSFGGHRLFGSKRRVIAADGISLSLSAGETIGIVGESGSGKSTIGKCCVRLLDPDDGEIWLDGVEIARLSNRSLRSQRHKIQMVFQDPFASLNPRQTVGASIEAGPLANGASKSEARARAEENIVRVGLPLSCLGRFPNEFSGGQRQRIGIARALALKPKVLIADEAVSALDVSVQAQILALLRRLRDELQLGLIFVTHDLRVAAQLCDRLIVMERGKVVESGATSEIFANPQHAYTQRLLSAVPGQGRSALRQE